jgi:hypothetical protein
MSDDFPTFAEVGEQNIREREKREQCRDDAEARE